MNQKTIRAAVEAMLFAYAEPVGADKLAQALQLPTASVEEALEDLHARYAREDSAFVCSPEYPLAAGHQDRFRGAGPPGAGHPPLGAAGPGGHGDADRYCVQPAGLPRLHRAGARRGFLVQRVRSAGKGAHRGGGPPRPAGPPGGVPDNGCLSAVFWPVQSGRLPPIHNDQEESGGAV